MPQYKYKARDSGGRLLEGTLEAENEKGIISNLRSKGLVVINISLQKKKIALLGERKKKVKLGDIVIFARQLATMVNAGLPLVQSLHILTEQTENLSFQKILRDIEQNVETGSNLSDAMGKYPAVFSVLFVNLVRAGEASGMLDEILNRLASYLEAISNLIRKIRSAMVYPIAVSIMAVVIVVVLMVKVVPTFKSIFADFGAQLPLPTMILVGISEIMQKYFLAGVAMLIALFFAFGKYARTEKGRYRFDSFKLKMKVFGPLLRKVAISKFTRTLATLVKSGVPILTSLEIVGKTSGNVVIEKAVIEVRDSIREGESIAQPLAKSGVFPHMVVQMIRVGEETGSLENMLGKISDFYDEQVDAAVAGLTSIIEPILIAFLGVVIGAIVIAMFMPIFQMTTIIAV
jgi:type IV pilus assembly protein PilC